MFFIFFPENSVRYFVQIIIEGNNFHEMSNLILGKTKYFKVWSAVIFTQHAKFKIAVVAMLLFIHTMQLFAVLCLLFSHFY